MDVEQRQDREMIEVTPKVYDIIYPTPLSLKELSAIAISLESWRHKVNEYITGGQLLKDFEPSALLIEFTWIQSIFPRLTPMIYKMIEKFFTRFVNSFGFWLFQHREKVFDSYTHDNDILQDFNDFSCDYDGSIHQVRTAERMIRCEGLNTDIKFRVACLYFLEEDIRRIWPSVSNNFDWDLSYSFEDFLQLYYWICRLSNRFAIFPAGSWRPMSAVDEKMLEGNMAGNRPSIEYFWNRIPPNKQLRRAIKYIDRLDFVRFILPKLNDHQLDKWVNNTRSNGGGFYSSFRDFHREKHIVLSIWLYIKNIINKNTFTHLAINLIKNVDNNSGEFDSENWEYLCRQIWIGTSLDFKESVISSISSESEWLRNMTVTNDYHYNQIHVEFLLLILQDSSIKERNLFWRNCWSSLIEAVRAKDLKRIAQLCFKSHEITEFKKNIMMNSVDVLRVCVSLLEDVHFDELNAFVSFCCPDLQTARALKQNILQSAFFDEDCKLNRGIVSRIVDLNEFINGAFDNVDLSTDFKNLLISSSFVMRRLSSIICDGGVSLETLAGFADTLVSTAEALAQVKMILSESLKECVMNNARDRIVLLFRTNKFNSILLWCLGSDENVAEFKSSCTSVPGVANLPSL